MKCFEVRKTPRNILINVRNIHSNKHEGKLNTNDATNVNRERFLVIL